MKKNIFCSFVGNITSNDVQPNVRQVMFDSFSTNPLFKMINSGGWTPIINGALQDIFVRTAIDSRFTLAPRGYGRASFRFFECFTIGKLFLFMCGMTKIGFLSKI